MYNPYQFSNPYYLQNYPQSYPQGVQNFTQPQPQAQAQIQPQTAVALQGKTIDNLDVAKVVEYPLDGSVSYFPLVDGSAIVTKQLQNDGKSKTVIYKPIEPEEIKADTPKYATMQEVEELLKQEPKEVKELKEEIKNLKRQIRDLSDDIKEYKRKD